MTNLEWLKEEISKMNEEELRDWKNKGSPWCEKGCSDIPICKLCAIAWLKKEHETPMPELENGMFVEYHDKDFENSRYGYDARGYGVVVDDKIVCQDGSCFYGLKEEDTINCITKVFNADYFNDCDDGACIWEKN